MYKKNVSVASGYAQLSIHWACGLKSFHVVTTTIDNFYRKLMPEATI